jgi:hypothetical protein
MPTPRKSKKARRHDAFSSGSFGAANESNPSRIQIHTDSRDHVPELDPSEENPFVNQTSEETVPAVRRVGGTSKRRRVTRAETKDPQVCEAIKDDEGMVYVL